MPGLFVRNQAEALVDQYEVAVLYVHADQNLAVGCETDLAMENGIRVCRIYYRVPSGFSVFNPVLKWIRFFRAHSRGMAALRFRPDLVHVHVLTRHALIAWFWKIKYGYPYIVSEHWSRYLPENNTYKGFIRKNVTRFIAWKANAMIAVSGRLRISMQCRKVDNRRWFIIPNIVDQDRFSLPARTGIREKKIILHISCFEDRSKNISGLLRALKVLSHERNDFICRIIGEGPDLDRMKQYARETGLDGSLVNFEGLRENREMIDILHDGDFLILTSHYETFGTVLAEAMSCGLPVVSTRVGIADEIVKPSTGILVDHDDESITAGINRMLDHYGEYDRLKIRQSVTGKFSKESVGRQLMDVYQTIVTS